MSRCKVIASCNPKGGVGKATTTINLAAALARAGFKVLAVDADLQVDQTEDGNCGMHTEETASRIRLNVFRLDCIHLLSETARGL